MIAFNNCEITHFSMLLMTELFLQSFGLYIETLTNCQLLAVPCYRLNTYGRRTISVAGSIVWNSLPDFIQHPTISADCFRRLLKTYLSARYYCIQHVRGS